MEEVPPDRERLYYMKCLAFILGIGMDVLLNYFEQKILGNSDFYCFVEDNKHYLYHAHNPSIKCCECSTLLLASSYKTRGLNKRQFEILFDIGLPTDMVHYQVGSNNQMTQDCLCRFMPKPSNDVDCMDITLMNAVIKACFFDRKLSIHGSPTDLETFKNTRNYLAHSSERRLSESEFKTKLQESEQAILGIAKSVGKYFAKESKRKIDAFKQDELSVAQIKRIIESNADGVSRELKKILDEQRNLPVHIQQVQEEIHRLLIKYKDELKVDIGNLSFDVRQNARWAISSSSREATLERRGPDQQTDIAAIGSSEQTTERVDNIHTCRVEWKLQTPGTWNLIKIQETLLNCSMLLQPWFKIEFVYIGSLVIKALVQKHTLDNRDKMRNSVHSFLKRIVEVCEINTEVSTVIKVDLMIELNELDHEKKGDQSLMLKAELEMEEDLMKLRPESEKGDQSLMLKAELEMEKDLVKLRPESEKGDKSLMLKAELEMEKDLVKLKPESEIGGDLMTLKAESGNEPLSRIHAARIEYAVKDVIPNIVKDLLTLYIPPQTLCRRVNSVHSFEPRLRAEEWTKIRNAASTGYRDFDVPLVLKLLNRLCGHNMGPKLREDMSIYGRYYDSIAHKLHSSIMFKEKFDTSFNDFKNIARGFEHIMHKRSNELVLQLEQLRGGVMDYHLEDVTDYLT